ncbi:hypothetical protein MTR67_001266 [Solanum verrucosum]|uniref:Uncharacterized protein n=1 Tax=Solanum verrucosum TaxID=315347 RepID=A0AAF0T7C4_SOLVR|nr:hypothetical protein MTR67_001266 [Solanum verrucosum]
MDAYGFKMFLNALSELIQGASAPSILPVWQRDLLSARSLPCIICTHNEFDENVESKNAWIAVEDKLIQHSFFFGNKEIEAIQDQLESGYVSVRKGLRKMELPLGYYGNAFATPAAISKAGLLCSNSFTYAVELIKQAKK